MKIYLALVMPALLLGCMSPQVSHGAEDAAFCVLPGESVKQLVAKCSSALLVAENTEEGPLPAYDIDHGKYRYRAEIDSGQVNLIRFTQNPLPISHIRIGDTFSSIRKICRRCELVTGAEESGYISLYDSADNVYFSFDNSVVPTDWHFQQRRDESVISEIPLISVNFVED
jgi:hypothetical protein